MTDSNASTQDEPEYGSLGSIRKQAVSLLDSIRGGWLLASEITCASLLEEIEAAEKRRKREEKTEASGKSST